ncbi:hypothetical protein Tco_0948231 [Tanacetum coccineum]
MGCDQRRKVPSMAPVVFYTLCSDVLLPSDSLLSCSHPCLEHPRILPSFPGAYEHVGILFSASLARDDLASTKAGLITGLGLAEVDARLASGVSPMFAGLFDGYVLGLNRTNCGGPTDGATDCTIFSKTRPPMVIEVYDVDG